MNKRNKRKSDKIEMRVLWVLIWVIIWGIIRFMLSVLEYFIGDFEGNMKFNNWLLYIRGNWGLEVK